MTIWLQLFISLIIGILAILDYTYLQRVEFKSNRHLKIVQYSIVAYFILDVMSLTLELFSSVLFLIAAISIYKINGNIFKYAMKKKSIVSVDS